MTNLFEKTRVSARLIAVLALLVTAACGARQENLALLSANDMYARAAEAMENRRHEQAINLLELFVTQYLGDPRAPEARMLLGEAYMARRDYLTAAAQYQRMMNDFPFHARALEARLRACEAYYLLSPRPPLDQQYTVSAVLYCQSVVENYPGTPEAETAEEYVDELRDKLATKTYNTGMHYFRRRAYDSAVVYFQEVVANFPDTPLAPAALEQLVETYTRIGYVEDAEETRQRLLREYPTSPQAQALRD